MRRQLRGTGESFSSGFRLLQVPLKGLLLRGSVPELLHQQDSNTLSGLLRNPADGRGCFYTGVSLLITCVPAEHALLADALQTFLRKQSCTFMFRAGGGAQVSDDESFLCVLDEQLSFPLRSRLPAELLPESYNITLWPRLRPHPLSGLYVFTGDSHAALGADSTQRDEGLVARSSSLSSSANPAGADPVP